MKTLTRAILAGLLLVAPMRGVALGAEADVRILQTQLEIEKRLLDAARRRWLDQLDTERRAAQAVDAAARGAAAAVARGDARPAAAPGETQPPSLEEASLALAEAERAMTAALAASKPLALATEQQSLRVAAVEAALAAFRQRAPATPLDGTWDISFMPGSRGILRLTQVGTLLTGDYSLESGASGSITGTFAGGTFMADRIDATAGRDAMLTGALAGDRLEGTWLAAIFGQGIAESGTWKATRKSALTAPPAEQPEGDETPPGR